jgi:hypothetical protein
MKAYKQINNSFENRIVFGYAGMLSLLSFFILLSPVFGQDTEPNQKNEPKVYYDVKREYDKDGNLTGYDSTFTWYWSDKGFGRHDYDSLIDQFNQKFNLFDQDENWLKNQPFFAIPNEEHFWSWNGQDSVGVLLNDSTFSHFLFDDPFGLSFFGLDDLSKFFDHSFDMDQYLGDTITTKNPFDQNGDFLERYKEYQKEQQKLIDKYFGKPNQNNKSEPKSEPQKLNPAHSPADLNKSGKV